ncbi:hypothetical protein [Desulfovibrio gilichinskyi]|nr:hypothetical protein [Desulfovibrio gilichinskyi]
MKNIVKLIILLFLMCSFPASAHARSMEEERSMCIALNALAKSQCKEPVSYSYVGKQGDSVYIYNTFYGSKDKDFFCKVGDGEVTIISRDRLFHRSVVYSIDENDCGVIEYSAASCTDKRVVKCCFAKSEKEIKADKEVDFWHKPIPELLQEDQKKALENLQNRTVKSSETKPE